MLPPPLASPGNMETAESIVHLCNYRRTMRHSRSCIDTIANWHANVCAAFAFRRTVHHPIQVRVSCRQYKECPYEVAGASLVLQSALIPATSHQVIRNSPSLSVSSWLDSPISLLLPFWLPLLLPAEHPPNVRLARRSLEMRHGTSQESELVESPTPLQTTSSRFQPPSTTLSLELPPTLTTTPFAVDR